MTGDETQALTAILRKRGAVRLSVAESGAECYRYHHDPMAPRGTALRAPSAGWLAWHAEPGPVEEGALLATIEAGGTRAELRSEAAGRLGPPLLGPGAFAAHRAALAVVYDAEARPCEEMT